MPTAPGCGAPMGLSQCGQVASLAQTSSAHMGQVRMAGSTGRLRQRAGIYSVESLKFAASTM